MGKKTYDEDAISFKEIIMTLLEHWKLVVLCAVAALLIGSVYVFFIAKPIYQSAIDGTVNIPEKIENEYGGYTFASRGKADYINDVLSDAVMNRAINSLGLDTTPSALKENISVSLSSTLNGIVISARAGSPEEANALAKTVGDAYVEEINISYRELAINYYLSQFEMKISRNSQEVSVQQMVVDGLETELAKISPTVFVKQSLLKDFDKTAAAVESGADLSDLADIVIYSETVNPSYTSMDKLVQDARKELQKFKAELESGTVLYNRLLVELAGVKAYRASGDKSGMQDPSLNILQSCILVANNASFSTSPIAPRKLLILALSLVLGLFLGGVLSLLKHYWKAG